MESVLKKLLWKICLVYIDDIVTFSEDFSSGLNNLRAVFSCLRDAGLKLKPQKCRLFSRQASFLGHIVSEAGVQCDPAKLKAVRHWSVPSNITEVRSFLGFASYYRRFFRNFAGIAEPLTSLIRKNSKFLWSTECQQAFDKIRKCLTSAPVRSYPMPDR
uniref:ribonuclease H n=1 Tax=Phallusia mammillata TaxID=59560 RepID=A0A6F9DIP7_9ASCI|nr:uncharacterized protein LOC108950853 [Phallusia mammillata]